MPTLDQIRAARALLNWSQSDLAERAGLSQTGIARIESGVNQPNLQTMERIAQAFDDAGIEFLGDVGLQRRATEIRTFFGKDGFRRFFDDVYNTVKDAGGDILISGVDEAMFGKYLSDFAPEHRERMKNLGNFAMKCLVCEGDYNFSASSYCTYRWTPRYLFESMPFYLYGDRLGILNFDQNEVSVHVLRHKKVADAFRKQFQIVWQNSLPPVET